MSNNSFSQPATKVKNSKIQRVVILDSVVANLVIKELIECDFLKIDNNDLDKKSIALEKINKNLTQINTFLENKNKLLELNIKDEELKNEALKENIEFLKKDLKKEKAKGLKRIVLVGILCAAGGYLLGK